MSARALKTITAAAVGVFGVAVMWFCWAYWVFLLPQQQPLGHADVIVSLAPASRRLPTALDAYERGLADELWVSTFPNDTRPHTSPRPLATQVCSPHANDADRTTCFTPETDDTIGEARMVAKLLTQSGGSSVIVTTHTSHAARTTFLFSHCLPPGTEIQMLLIDDPDSRRYLLRRMVYETGASMKALWQVTLGGCHTR